MDFYRLYSSLPEQGSDTTWAEIDLGALRHNYRLLCGQVEAGTPAHSAKIRPIAVVKADAYGHGAPACVEALLREGCDFFAVSCFQEAEAVRAVCREKGARADVLILGYTAPSLAQDLARLDVIQAVLSEEYAHTLNENASRAGVTVRTHLALDTGMNRIGLPAQSDGEIQSTARAIESIDALGHLRTEGLFTHFARADEGEDGVPATDLQADRFRRVRDLLPAPLASRLFCHVCNSAASVERPRDYWNGVRFGILLYGVRPSDRVDLLPVRPVMKLKTVVSHVHTLLPGEAVSYGGTFRCEGGERRVATLPIGYADGFLRAYTGALVTVHTGKGERKVPIVGRICMDQCMIDVTGTDVRTGDPVTLFGNEPEELYALADRAGTIGYESLCLLSARVGRTYLAEKEEKPCP